MSSNPVKLSFGAGCLFSVYLLRQIYLLECNYNDLRYITHEFLNSKGISLDEFARYACMRGMAPKQVASALRVGVPFTTSPPDYKIQK